jgi:predicted dinucleotide-binding enzyme
MKEKRISVAAIVLMTVPALASAEITDSLSGTIATGAIVIYAGNNLNPDESNRRLHNLDSSADSKTTFLPGILPEVTWDVGEPELFLLCR